MVSTDNELSPEIKQQQRYLVLAGFLSLLGTASYAAAEQLQVKLMTNSATWLGGVLIVVRLSQFLVGPVAGVFADRLEARRYLIRLDLVMALIAFAVATMFAFGWFPHLQLMAIFSSALMISLLAEVYVPFYSASTGKTFNRDQLRRLQSFRSQAAEVARLSGPSLGALLFQAGGMMLAAAANGFGFLLSAFFVAKAFPKALAETAVLGDISSRRLGEKLSSFWQHFAEGIVYIKGRKGMLGFTLGAAVTNFFITAQHVTLPFFISNERGWSSAWFGHALSALALGSFVGAWGARYAGRWGDRAHGTLIWILLPMPGLFWALVSNAQSPWQLVALCLLANVSFSFVGVSLLPKIISDTAPELRGRVFSVLMNITVLLTPPGALFAGRMLDARVLVPSSMFMVCGIAIVVAWLLFLTNATTRHWVGLRSDDAA